MRGGPKLGIALLITLVIALPSLAAAGGLFLNGEELTLHHPAFLRGGDLFVPLRELGLLLGVEVASGDNELQLRSAEGEQGFTPSAFISVDGVYYIRLAQLAQIAGAQVHKIGDDVYVETVPVPLNSVECKSDRVTARFSAFVPYMLVKSGAGRFVVTFYHTSLATAPRDVTVTGGVVHEVSLTTAAHATATVTIDAAAGSIPVIKRFTAPGFYSVSLTFDHRTGSESQTQVSSAITYHEITTDLGNGPVKIHYLYIEDWSMHYRLVPAVPETGVGTLAALADIARAHGAAAGINANFFDTKTDDPIGLLIINGEVLSSNYKRRAALGIDLFGKLTFFTPHVKIYLRTDMGKIAVDDVNRPIKQDEAIAYTPGYAGPIRTGITPDMFRVVKVASGHVVSVEDAPYIIPNRTTTLVVACGAARARLEGISVGDKASLEYTLDQGNLMITDAVSAGPLLISAGKDVLNPPAEGFDAGSYLVTGRAARSVLATDPLGGLILLTVVKDETSVGANFHDLLSILHALPVRISNAIAFDGGHTSSLVFKEGATYREVASGGEVAVGLLLVPTGR